MEQVENQVSSNPPSNTGSPGTIEEQARDIGRKVDSASARMQSSWDEASSQVKNKLGSTGVRVKAKLSGAGTKAKQKLAAARTATSDKALVYRTNVEHKVQAHPLRSVGVAFGAGALIGLMLRRRR
jgi:ElaB/YqjD/DUF883 family membrane-anchored ribosome-binding protein